MSKVVSVTKAILEIRLGKNLQNSVASEKDSSEIKDVALRIANRRKAKQHLKILL